MKKLTQTEIKWLKEIVANTIVRFSARELRQFKIYLAKSILEARA